MDAGEVAVERRVDQEAMAMNHPTGEEVEVIMVIWEVEIDAFHPDATPSWRRLG